MKDRLEKIWSKLGKSDEIREGIEKIRYSDSSPAGIYIGYKIPEQYPMFSLSLPKKNITKSFYKSNYRSFRIDLTTDEINPNNIFINLLLTNVELIAVFNILISDFIVNIENVNDEDTQLVIFVQRFSKWQNLFDNIHKEHLQDEAQRGLFGELHFLRRWISSQTSPIICINGWLGPDKAVHDFKTGMVAVEVKTTISTSHQKIQINNERQLDDTNLNALFIFCLSLDERISAGLTLPEIIEEIRIHLIDYPVLMTEFNLKLALYGYYEHHISFYRTKGFFIRDQRFFAVASEFPRIKEKDIMNGVGDVKYTISLDSLTSFESTEPYVFSQLNIK